MNVITLKKKKKKKGIIGAHPGIESGPLVSTDITAHIGQIIRVSAKFVFANKVRGHFLHCLISPYLFIIPTLFLKKRRGYCNRLRRPSVRLSVRPSVTLSPPKPLDEIQPNLVCELLT